MNDIVINKAQGSLGEVAPGADFVAGMIFFSDTLPAGFTALTRTQQVLSIEAAEALGTGGRVLVRESGTEPVIRVMVEAENDELCEKHVNNIVDKFYKKGHIVQ